MTGLEATCCDTIAFARPISILSVCLFSSMPSPIPVITWRNRTEFPDPLSDLLFKSLFLGLEALHYSRNRLGDLFHTFCLSLFLMSC